MSSYHYFICDISSSHTHFYSYRYLISSFHIITSLFLFFFYHISDISDIISSFHIIMFSFFLLYHISYHYFVYHITITLHFLFLSCIISSFHISISSYTSLHTGIEIFINLPGESETRNRIQNLNFFILVDLQIK